jgi:hypothetical protein
MGDGFELVGGWRLRLTVGDGCPLWLTINLPTKIIAKRTVNDHNFRCSPSFRADYYHNNTNITKPQTPSNLKHTPQPHQTNINYFYKRQKANSKAYRNQRSKTTKAAAALYFHFFSLL